MFLLVLWRNNETGKMDPYSDYEFSMTYTDYGVCCRIYPQMDFDNNETKNIPVAEYPSKNMSKYCTTKTLLLSQSPTPSPHHTV